MKLANAWESDTHTQYDLNKVNEIEIETIYFEYFYNARDGQFFYWNLVVGVFFCNNANKKEQ